MGYSLCLLAAVLLTLSVLGAAGASPVQGTSLTYSYAIETGDRSVEGRVVSKVLEDVGGGIVRARIEVYFNDGVATLEKPMNGSLLRPPSIRLIPGTFTFNRDNVSISVTVTQEGTGSTVISGRFYQTMRYSIRSTADVEGTETQSSARVVTVQPSNVIVYVELSALAQPGRSLKLRVQLTEANVDLSRVQTRSLIPLFPVLAGSTSNWDFGSMIAPLVLSESQAITQMTKPVNDDSDVKLTIVGVSGTVALAALTLSMTVWRKPSRRNNQPIERKPHYI
ncbi:MAG: hypothetical protein NZ920_01450 [Aigarchaeota archaeon]|nr:hypothetical protein [Aigarchaeota archaeon]MDW8093107.1 hypothetical protein [Nitrososphaerota archaeon]